MAHEEGKRNYRGLKIKATIFAIMLVLLCSCGAEQNVRKGDKFWALGEYFEAADQYKLAYQRTPAKEKQNRGKRALKLAHAYDKLGYTQKAMAAYTNALRYHQDDSLTLLRLGFLQLKDGKYRDSEKSLIQYLDSVYGDPLAETLLQNAQTAAARKKDGSRYTVKRMDVFNSRRADYSPALCGDQFDQLYFTSTRNQAQGDELSGITGMKNGDIFFSQKDDKGKWGKPETIESGLNTEEDEGACQFTPDGKTMYLTQCLTDASYPRYATICTSQRSDAAWGKATPLTITRDTLSSYAHPAISPDGEWLYFTSDMPGGEGGLDIWRIRLTANGSLGGVENLGPEINTPGNEEFPTFRPNGDLYFSSDGRKDGLGGLDVYCAHWEVPESKLIKRSTTTNAGHWVIEHPGYPLNSQGDDFGLTFEGPHNRGFFSSNRGDAKGWDHIYSFECPEIIQTVKGWVYEQDGYELPAAQVYLVGNDGTNMKLNVLSDGSFTQVIKPDVSYALLGTCKGYLNHKEELRVDSVTESEEYVLQFPLASISAPVLIRNINYDFDKATLRPESEIALDTLVTLLNENPHVTIELSAHTDNRGSDDYNKRLSQRRAESVVQYLISRGIAADRLTPVGYGEERPKTIKRRLAEQYEWAKEGDVLTEEYILKLKPEEQEEAHQLNRRTEFFVLKTTYGMFKE